MQKHGDGEYEDNVNSKIIKRVTMYKYIAPSDINEEKLICKYCKKTLSKDNKDDIKIQAHKDCLEKIDEYDENRFGIKMNEPERQFFREMREFVNEDEIIIEVNEDKIISLKIKGYPSTLPESIGNLINLKILNLGYCDLNELPKTLGKLMNNTGPILA